MSEIHDLPNADDLTRQPRGPSGGGNEQISAEDALAEMREQLERATADKLVAERSAHEERQGRVAAETRVTEATGTALTAHERQIEANIETQKGIVDRAEASIAQAYGAGDPVAIARAQREMAEATARLTSLSDQKSWLDNEKARQAAEAKRVPVQEATRGAVRVTTPGGDLEVSPTDKDWMDKHSRFYSDGDYYNHALTAHARIERDGIRPGTTAYYRELDTAMQKYEAYEAHERGDAPVNDGLSQRQQMRRAPASSMAAPVSRASAPRQQSNGALSAAQVAQYIGPGVTEADLREYARINGLKGEEGFQRYLAQQTEIINLDRAGADTGLRSDAMYR